MRQMLAEHSPIWLGHWFFLLLIDLEFLWWILNIWKGKSTLAGIREHCRSGGEFEGLKHKTGKATTATIYTFLCLSYLSKIHRGKYKEEQARKPQSYASRKLSPTEWLTHSLKGVKCRATSVAKKKQCTNILRCDKAKPNTLDCYNFIMMQWSSTNMLRCNKAKPNTFDWDHFYYDAMEQYKYITIK